jgi:hypothetical protein
VSANGGKANPALVIWEDPKELQLTFSQGVFSKRQFALLSNANLIKKEAPKKILISSHYTGESDDEGKIELNKENVTNVFVYNAETFDRINPIEVDLEKGVITIGSVYTSVEIDY